MAVSFIGGGNQSARRKRDHQIPVIRNYVLLRQSKMSVRPFIRFILLTIILGHRFFDKLNIYVMKVPLCYNYLLVYLMLIDPLNWTAGVRRTRHSILYWLKLLDKQTTVKCIVSDVENSIKWSTETKHMFYLNIKFLCFQVYPHVWMMFTWNVIILLLLKIVVCYISCINNFPTRKKKNHFFFFSE